MRKLFANMDIKLKAPMCAQLPSVEAGDSKKAPATSHGMFSSYIRWSQRISN